ncbi:MAG: hypothetical protein RBT63_06435 [Bdellovibrionales bacterium]|jgi:hypothetical protein|nr:hypothetical protein [Bdellovibrionales bacterium]
MASRLGTRPSVQKDPQVAKDRVDLSELESVIDMLVSGNAKRAEVAARLKAMGQPEVMDGTEQLRLALRLLECHDDEGVSRKLAETST